MIIKTKNVKNKTISEIIYELWENEELLDELLFRNLSIKNELEVIASHIYYFKDKIYDTKEDIYEKV